MRRAGAGQNPEYSRVRVTKLQNANVIRRGLDSGLRQNDDGAAKVTRGGRRLSHRDLPAGSAGRFGADRVAHSSIQIAVETAQEEMVPTRLANFVAV